MGWLDNLKNAALETVEGVGEAAFSSVGEAVNQKLPGILGIDKGAQPDTGSNAQNQTLYQAQNPTVTGAPVMAGPMASGMPSWVIPAAIGGGSLVLVAVLMLARKG